MPIQGPSARKLLHLALRIAPAVFFVAAVALLAREVRLIDADHVWAHLAAISPWQWLAALLATACGYGVLTLYDVLGLRLIGARLPYRAAAEGAFLSSTISHNVGLGWISGGTMRQRVYGPLGLSLPDVARLTLVNSLTFFIGGFVLLGAVLIGEPQIGAPLLPLPQAVVQLAGCALWFGIACYLMLCSCRREPIGSKQANLPIPKPRMALAQIALSTADISLAAGALYILLPPDLGIGFALLFGAYLVALSASLLTHVPGGLGILETLILWSLPALPKPPLLAALIAYRIVYYLIPLAVALSWMFGRAAIRMMLRATVAARETRRIVPFMAAALSLASGAFLLFSGATPPLDARFAVLRPLVPLPLLELSHLAGSIAGLALAILGGALYRRYDTARNVAILLLLGGGAAILLRGESVIGALALAGAALALKASGAAFYRRGSIWRNAITPAWIGLGLLALGASVWAGLHAYANVKYTHDLWWQFAYDAAAPRFLRASLLVGLLGFALLAMRLLGPARPSNMAQEPGAGVREAVAASADAQSNLALLGDKRFLVSASGKSFLMYQVEGRSWIAMGDPVGPRSDWEELIWHFRDRADVAGGRAIFYEALGEHLDLYADAGLVAHKIGEEARVELGGFTLEGAAAKSFRATLRRGERDGLSFEIVQPQDIPPILGELEEVSREWLAVKRAPEKQFSMGAFDRAYIAQFDCAVVRRAGRIIAFANLWLGADFQEASMDLMRHRADSPRGTMMFLILHLMLWARGAGYSWFNLGMAPLSGLARHRLAPKWHAVGRLIFTHGERLYGFGGLRRFKEQFRPVWRPRYIVCSPGILTLAFALADCARLISRRPAGRSLSPAAGRPSGESTWKTSQRVSAAGTSPFMRPQRAMSLHVPTSRTDSRLASGWPIR